MKKKHASKVKEVDVPKYDSLADIQNLKDEFVAEESTVMVNLIQQTPVGASITLIDPAKSATIAEVLTENTTPQPVKIGKRKRKA